MWQVWITPQTGAGQKASGKKFAKGKINRTFNVFKHRRSRIVKLRTG